MTRTNQAFRKIRGLHVISYISQCLGCQAIIPYGRLYCQGHAMMGKRKFQVNEEDPCSDCGRAITMRKHKRKDGSVTSTRPLIHYNEDNKVICHRCMCKSWNQKHKEYVKIYRKIYWYEKGVYFNQQKRIRASIRRGYIVSRID